MTMREVTLAVDGLRDRDLYNQELLRRSTFIIASSMGGKNVARQLEKLWPIEGKDGKADVQARARERLEQEYEMNAKRRANKKLRS